jgi:hypothetical protein
LFLNALKPLLVATRVAVCQSITTELVAVTAEANALKGVEGVFAAEQVAQLVGILDAIRERATA